MTFYFMRHKIYLPVVLLLLAVTGLPAAGSTVSHVDDPIYQTYNGFTIPAEAVLPAKEIHPSIWFNDGDLPALRQKRDADDFSRNLWRQISTNELLTMPLPEPPLKTDSRAKIQGYYGTMSRIAKLNALMYLLGDKANREQYRARAVTALERAYDGPIYEMYFNDPAINGIYRGTFAQNYAAAYDWVQASLTPAEDQAIRARLVKEAEFMAANLYGWASRPHNHLSKPAWGLGTLALTLSDNPNAKAWLAEVIKASNQNTKYFFSADGIYREGAHYLLFSAINFIPFLYHYRNVSGVDDFPVFQPAFEAIVAIRNGKGWLPNLYDAYIKPFPTELVAAAYRTNATWLNPAAKLGNVLQWNFRNTDLSPFIMAQKATGWNYTGDTWGYMLDVDEFLTYEPSIQPEAPSVSPTIFLKGGQSVFRNNWNYNDPNTRYLLFQGVALADNHYQQQNLSFIIQAENQMMASAPGYSRNDFGEKIHWDWYVAPASHNVVTADGQTPGDPADDVTPVSRDSLIAPFFAFQEKEAAYADHARQKRAIAFPGDDYFVVIDQLTAPQPVDYELYLHGGRGKMTSDGNRRVWDYSHDAYGPAAKFAAWILSAGAKLQDQEGEVTYIKGDYASFGYVTATQKATNTTFMQILIPLSAMANLPKVTDLSTEQVIAATVEKNGNLDTLMARRGAEMSQAGNANTDGEFAWTRTHGKIQQWAVQAGTTLDYAGVELFHSSIPITLAGRETTTGFGAMINAGDSRYTLTLPIPPNQQLKSVSFNGAELKATTEAGRISVTLNGSGKLVMELTASN